MLLSSLAVKYQDERKSFLRHPDPFWDFNILSSAKCYNKAIKIQEIMALLDFD